MAAGAADCGRKFAHALGELGKAAGGAVSPPVTIPPPPFGPNRLPPMASRSAYAVVIFLLCPPEPLFAAAPNEANPLDGLLLLPCNAVCGRLDMNKFPIPNLCSSLAHLALFGSFKKKKVRIKNILGQGIHFIRKVRELK